MKGKLGILCGGSGSSKFVRPISRYSIDIGFTDLQFVANVADNFWHHGLFVCPDIDILTYALTRNLDTSKGWGVENDKFLVFQKLSDFQKNKEWFNLGDKDLALSLKRTELLGKGWTLSSVTQYICDGGNSSYSVIPATDDSLQTFVRTFQGWMHLQEYWVKNRGELEALQIEFAGLSNARPNAWALEACSNNVIICPANPISSILPIVQLKGFSRQLSKSKVVAVSPFLGDKPFSGPAAKLLAAFGLQASSYAVAKLYSKFLDIFFVDTQENIETVKRIQDLGIECVKTNIRMEAQCEESIAKEILSAF
ncbi:MAG: 2-phospho-L-lactate transferase CofD family protein [Nitrososphaerales archaeon]